MARESRLLGAVQARARRPGAGVVRLDVLEARRLLSAASLDAALAFLDEQMDRDVPSGDVYTELDAGSNLYAASGVMNNPASPATPVLEVDVGWTTDPYAGRTCVRTHWTGQAGLDGSTWAGVSFEWPVGNMAGAASGAGWDLSAAAELSFLARSDSPVDTVLVGVGTTGHDGFEARMTLDSLTGEWQEFTIPLVSAGLTSLNNGFLVLFNETHDVDGGGVTVYFDDIRFDASAASERHLLPSYVLRDDLTVAEQKVSRNACYTYDNALAVLAYAARGTPRDWDRAEQIVQTFQWILNHEQIDAGLEGYVTADRAFVRDAYRSGPIAEAATGQPREAGWTDDNGTWHALGRAIGTGPNAWVMLAMLAVYRHAPDAELLTDIVHIGNWIHDNFHDATNGGYTLGLTKNGLPEAWPGVPKSTEHNIDVCAAFAGLAEAYGALGDTTSQALWQGRSDDAGQFVMGMHHAAEGRFHLGSTDDGATPSDEIYALDPQSWSILALSGQEPYASAIDWSAPADWATAQLGATSPAITDHPIVGYDYGLAPPAGSGEPDGVWLEGTAQMAAAYAALGQWAPYDLHRSEVWEVQEYHPHGDARGVVAAVSDGLTTGFGDVYNATLHLGSTAWAILAETAFNPFTNEYLSTPEPLSTLGVAFPSWWYDEYESAASDASLAALAVRTNIDTVEIVPTWYMATATANTIYADWPAVGWGTASDAGVQHVIQQCHALGLSVLLKPHVDVDTGTWRGAIAPTNVDAWFQSYRAFLTHYAQIAQNEGVEMFAVGTELKSLSGATYSAEWDTVVDEVEAIYTGSLTYSANHDEYASVSFWDRLDAVGLDAYFDLAAYVDGADPTREDLVDAWQPYVAAVNAWLVEQDIRLPVLLTEIGYLSVSDAYDEPWRTGSRSAAPDEQAQQRCYDAALQVWSDRPWAGGLLWWAWSPDLTRDIPNASAGTGYVPYNKRAEESLRLRLQTPDAADPWPLDQVHRVTWTAAQPGDALAVHCLGPEGWSATPLADAVDATTGHFDWDAAGSSQGWYYLCAWVTSADAGPTYRAGSPGWLLLRGSAGAAPPAPSAAIYSPAGVAEVRAEWDLELMGQGTRPGIAVLPSYVLAGLPEPADLRQAEFLATGTVGSYAALAPELPGAADAYGVWWGDGSALWRAGLLSSCAPASLSQRRAYNGGKDGASRGRGLPVGPVAFSDVDPLWVGVDREAARRL